MLETMTDFFASRIESYENQMLNNVVGCREGYEMMADIIGDRKNIKILDLGCGTGLEIDYILKKNPECDITAVDLSEDMLAVLHDKHPDVKCINCDYLKFDFLINEYDYVISFETLHHLREEAKKTVYSHIYESLKINGVYIECDYMAETDDIEKQMLYEDEKYRSEQNLSLDDIVHSDIPFTTEHQIEIISDCGFVNVNKRMRIGNTSLICARKPSVRKGRYRHFKGNEYEVVDTALNSESLEEFIIYRSLYGDGRLWIRPSSMWNEEIERDGKKYKRFTLIN